MANVKVLADKETDKRTGQKQYVPDLSMRGHKNFKHTCSLQLNTKRFGKYTDKK